MKLVFLVGVALLFINTGVSLPSNASYLDYDSNFEDHTEKDVQQDDDYGEDTNDDSLQKPNLELQLISKSQEFVVRENEAVYLPCEAKNADNFVNIWKKGDLPIYQDKTRFYNFDDNYIRMENKTLFIKKVGPKEVGQYSCNFHVSNNNIISITHIVSFKEPANIIAFGSVENTTVYEKGQNMALMCKATGHPKPKIIWSFKGKKQSEGESFTIDNIDREQSGNYQCVANNHVGEPSYKSIAIKVIYKPWVKAKSMTVVSAEGYYSELSCTVHADPQAEFKWKKDDVEVIPNDRITISNVDNMHVLKIMNTQMSDFGQYTCFAVNELGSGEKNISLTGNPSKPKLLPRDENPKSKNPILKWEVESNYPIDEHVLRCRKEGGKWMVFHPKIKNANGNIYIIEHEFENIDQMPYEVRVRSKNTFGWSEWSEIEVFNGTSTRSSHKHHQHHHKVDNNTKEDNSGPLNLGHAEDVSVKENIRQDKSSKPNNGQESLLSSKWLSCLLFIILAMNIHQ